MNFESHKMSLIERVISIREESTLKKFEELLVQAGLTDRNTPISLEEYNQQIDDAEKRIADRKFTTHEDLEKEMKEW